MTREEFSMIAAKMVMNWDNIGKGKIELFYEKFGNLPPELWARVVDRVIDNENYSPTVATIKRYLVEILRPRLPDASEQWARYVLPAIKRASVHADADFQAMPELVRRGVGTALQLRQWAVDEHFNEGVVRSVFIREYERAAAEQVHELQAADTPDTLCRIAQDQFGAVQEVPKLGRVTRAVPALDVVQPSNQGKRDLPPEVTQKLNAFRAEINAKYKT